MDGEEVKKIFSNLLSLFHEKPNVKLKTCSTWRSMVELVLLEDVNRILKDELGLSISNFTADSLNDTPHRLPEKIYTISDRLRIIHKVPPPSESVTGGEYVICAYHNTDNKTIYICSRLVVNVTDALIIFMHELGHHFTKGSSEEKAERWLETRWPYYYSQYKKKFEI